MSRLHLCLLAVVCLTAASCSSDEPFRKETFPVIGKVTVDGAAPGSPIQVHCHPVGGMDTTHPTFSQTETLADGTFKISTYESGDGVPEGDYKITFIWQNFNIMTREYSGPDKLNTRYSDPEKAEFKITVKKGEPNDMGEIKLTTK
jgi:hypothetical protein